jgi:cell division septation protein DedD
MKLFGISKPLTARIAGESVSGTLSWQPGNRCNSFTRESILAYAPPTSGVYGLFNIDCQIFIGDSENIRDALLRHESETDFEQLKPTGFCFELCAAKLRKLWAAELIARFHPLLQTEAALREPKSLLNDPMTIKRDEAEWKIGTYTDHQEFDGRSREKRPNVYHSWPSKRARALTLAAMLVVAVLIYFGVPADYAIHNRAASVTVASGQREMELRPTNSASNETTEGPANPNVVTAATATQTKPVPASQKNTGVNELGVQTKTGGVADSPGISKLGKKWSVQIAAEPTKDIADTLVQRLNAKGYDGYVVSAAVNGRTYYRVRVGQFDSRERAESLRQSLARQEGYRDAYLTGD